MKHESQDSEPARARVEGERPLRQWRETVLLRLATVFLVVGALPMCFLMWHHWQAGRGQIAILAALLFSGLLPIRFAASWDYRVRATLLVALVAFGGIVNYLVAGLAGGGAVVLGSATLLAALLLGARWGFAVLGLTTLGMAGVGAVFSAQLLPLPDSGILDPAIGSNWIRATLFYLGMSSTVVAAAVFLVGRLERSLRKSHQLVGELRREIHDREKAQRGQTQAEESLRHAQKMEAIGTLAGGIAHDFNNILSGVLGYAELAREDAAGNPELQQDLDQVLQAANRARDLVAQILTFSREREGELRPLRMQHVVKEVLKLLRASIPATIEIQLRIAEDCGPVLADATQIHQVVMNLCTNAYQAMRDGGGTLEVALRELVLDESETAAYPDLVAGPCVELRVSDNGVGMDHETRARIFDPYFTTRTKGEGTGLGLAMVHSIVKSYRGAILVSSEPDRGTTFRVILPSCAPDDDAARQPTTGPAARGTEHVLFVDDEIALTELSRTSLERLGYRVTTCSSGAEALNAFERSPDDFDVVVTDVSMPRMDGVELARRIRQLSPAIPIIACTGFSEPKTERQLRDAGIASLVMKPVVARELSQAIRAALDR